MDVAPGTASPLAPLGARANDATADHESSAQRHEQHVPDHKAVRQKWRPASPAVSVLLIIGFLVLMLRPSLAGYFPRRPPGTTTRNIVGTLMSYGIGNGSGTLTIKAQSGALVDIKAGYPMMMNGKVVHCTDPDPAMADYCKDWPSNIKIGTTVVTAVCWIDTKWNGGGHVFTDEIDVGRAPHPRRRAPQ